MEELYAEVQYRLVHSEQPSEELSETYFQCREPQQLQLHRRQDWIDEMALH